MKGERKMAMQEISDEAWKKQQAKVAKYLADFFDPEKRAKMVFVSNAPKDPRIFANGFGR